MSTLSSLSGRAHSERPSWSQVRNLSTTSISDKLSSLPVRHCRDGVAIHGVVDSEQRSENCRSRFGLGFVKGGHCKASSASKKTRGRKPCEEALIVVYLVTKLCKKDMQCLMQANDWR